MWDVEDRGGEVTVPLHGDQPSGTVSDSNTVCVYVGFYCLIWMMYLYGNGSEVFLGWLVWFVVYEYYCSETTTAQTSLGYVSLVHSRAAKHTCTWRW